MDPLTHAISGAALARALPSQLLPRHQFWLLVVLTMAPDADIVLKFYSDALYLAYHRGITHSLLMLPLWSWLIWSLLGRWRSTRPLVSWWLIAAALGLHIGFDLITSFGTMVVAPFSDWRAALDLVFIIDPIFTLLLLLPLLFMLVFRSQARYLAIASLALAVGYLLLCATMHARAMGLVEQAWPQAQLRAALPMPLSPFRWRLLALTANEYRMAEVDLWSAFSGSAPLLPHGLRVLVEQPLPPHPGQWQHFKTMDSVLDSGQARLAGVVFYRWFARFPVLIDKHGAVTEFGDLRFALRGGLTGSPFRLRLHDGASPTDTAKTRMVMRDGKGFVIE
ncbi:MAG: metal-dependent hydrolase [Mariprofundales bacterium]